ncbi:MAG: AAA family ATPase [Planctomycetota bacterium]|jgi:deoxyadenosine/deoxycytidine kinase
MKQGRSNNGIKQKSPFIVELVGPAGAGKTTLARALGQRDERIRIGAELELRKMKHIPIFLANASFLLPVFLRRCQHSRWFTWDEIKAMVYLKGWPRFLRQQASNNGAIILLDHGPVFKLAMLNAFGPERLRSKDFEEWWDNMLKQWAFTLDMVIWLDASDTNLLERINTRNQRHAVKGKPEGEAYKFLARYRTSYEQILAKLTTYKDPTLFQFDTSQASIEQIVDEVLIAYDNMKLREN